MPAMSELTPMKKAHFIRLSKKAKSHAQILISSERSTSMRTTSEQPSLTTPSQTQISQVDTRRTLKNSSREIWAPAGEWAPTRDTKE